MEAPSETSNHASPVPTSLPAPGEKGEPAVPLAKESRFKVKIVDELPTSTLPRNRDRMSVVDKNDTLNESMHVTFGQNTHEAVPSIAYYRNIFSTTAEAKRRPTLAELHDPKRKDVENSSPEDQEVGNVVQSPGSKFGWIKGVLVRCLLNIWGVMLFLRLTWITGQAGVGCATIIILMSTVVTVLTTLSMSAICTNGQVKGGGAYYMISRSLGPEFGGSIGLIFSLANAVAVAMYVVGFSETTRDLLHDSNLILVDEINDVRIIGAATLVVCLCITMIGMAWEARAQLILLVILICSILVLVIGSMLPPTQDEFSKGFVGFNAGTFKENFKPAYTAGESFFSIFSIFFPAATGILAGANISGDLRDAQKAIPKGTLLAIGITSVVYIGLVWLLGAVMVREASGNTADYFPVYGVVNASIAYITNMPTTTNMPATNLPIPTTTTVICGAGKACKYGLLNDLQAAYVISAFAPFIIAGIFAATLSSALASLVSAPKVFQAVCKDNVFPKTKFFAKGVGPTDEPKRAYVLTFFIALAFIALGELNAIAPIISNFFLASYALINFSCFSASLSKTPGWRPAFKYYNKWVALLASVICIAVMFLINWYAACFTVAVVGALYLYVNHKKPEINWGSSTQALTYKQALQCTVKLLTIPEHTKTFRPQCLIFSGAPECRPALVHFVSHITKNNSLLICGNVIIGNQEENRDQMTSIMNDHTNWLLRQKIKGFYSPIISKSLRSGAQSLLQISGLGKLRPNTVFLGFKSDWQKDVSSNVVDYVGIIHDAFDLNYGVAILRFPQGLDVSAALNMQAQQNGRSSLPKPSEQTINEAEPLILEESGESAASDDKETKLAGRPLEDSTALIRGRKPGSVIKSVNAFQDKQAKGTIDVWWLFDDGGLTLLIPHILTLRRQWERCKLRVFAGGKKDQIEKEKISMANMLSKFRIDCHSVEIVPDIGKKPQGVSLASFESLVEPWMLTADQDVKDFPGYITAEERKNLKEKTYRHIRLRELLFKHSKDANLIFLTLPMPRKEACSAYMYMAWLETLCNAKDLPPIVLMRGNQTSVLTYYS